MKDLKVLRWMSLLMVAVLVLESVRLFVGWRDGGQIESSIYVGLLMFVAIALEIIRNAIRELSTELEELRARLAKGTDS